MKFSRCSNSKSVTGLVVVQGLSQQKEGGEYGWAMTFLRVCEIVRKCAESSITKPRSGWGKHRLSLPGSPSPSYPSPPRRPATPAVVSHSRTWTNSPSSFVSSLIAKNVKRTEVSIPVIFIAHGSFPLIPKHVGRYLNILERRPAERLSFPGPVVTIVP